MTPSDVSGLVAIGVIGALLLITAWFLGRPDKGSGDGRSPDDED